jgi:hypothetical protein
MAAVLAGRESRSGEGEGGDGGTDGDASSCRLDAPDGASKLGLDGGVLIDAGRMSARSGHACWIDARGGLRAPGRLA